MKGWGDSCFDSDCRRKPSQWYINKNNSCKNFSSKDKTLKSLLSFNNHRFERFRDTQVSHNGCGGCALRVAANIRCFNSTRSALLGFGYIRTALPVCSSASVCCSTGNESWFVLQTLKNTTKHILSISETHSWPFDRYNHSTIWVRRKRMLCDSLLELCFGFSFSHFLANIFHVACSLNTHTHTHTQKGNICKSRDFEILEQLIYSFIVKKVGGLYNWE